MRTLRFWIPENLDIDKVIQQNKTAYMKHRLKRDYLLFICHSLVTARVSSRKQMLEDETTFAELCSSKLDKMIHNYNLYLTFLLEAGVIATDNYFITGKKCRGYCFNEPYAGKKLKLIEVDNYVLKKAIRNNAQDKLRKQKKETRGYSYLTEWLDDGKLQIDAAGAYDWIEKDLKDRIAKILSSKARGKRRRKKMANALDTAEDFRCLVRNFDERVNRYGFSGQGHRFYSVLTNMKKELRSFITYDGQQLIDIDIKNSQPFLSITLLQKSFWLPKHENSKCNLERLDKELYKRIREGKGYNHTITLLNTVENQYQQGFRDLGYSRLVASGLFYEYVQQHFSTEFPDRFSNRSTTKKEVMRFLFFNSKKEHYQYYAPSRKFMEHFPEVHELFKLIKEVDYKHLPLILQRVESYLVIDKACKRISKCYPEVPMFTIHDNILTTKGNEGIVKFILEQEIEAVVGFKPTLVCSQPKVEKCPIVTAPPAILQISIKQPVPVVIV